MSQENVEVVRSYFRALQRTLSAYAAAPGRIDDAPFLDEVFAHLDDNVEWRWPLSPESFRGRAEMLRAAADWLDAVGGWQVELEDVVEAGDRVLVSQRVRAQGKGSGAPTEQQVHTVGTIRDGHILRLEDYLDRRAAREAAGLSE
jgi:ketosteroid isomerase-like protein